MRTLIFTKSFAIVSLMKCASALSLLPRRSFLPMTALINGSPSRPISQLHSTSHPLTYRNDIAVESSSAFKGESELLVVPFTVDSNKKVTFPTFSALPSPLCEMVNEMSTELVSKSQSEDFDPARKEIFRVFPRYHKTKHVAFIPISNSGDHNGKSGSFQFGKGIASIIAENRIESVGVIENGKLYNSKEDVSGILLGLHDVLYKDERFKGKKTPASLPLKSLQMISSVNFKEIAMEAKVAADSIASGVYFAKDIVGAPSNWKTPEKVAHLAEELANQYGMECKVLGMEECQTLGMGAYLSVQQGSKFPPKFVHLCYKGECTQSQQPTKIALVGKGLTFDSGGYNLKAGAGSMIELMKFDVGGCAAVLGSALAIGKLMPKDIEVHFISPLCENMISSDAMRPGDICKASNGKTIEIINTDAEGRLALADALCYAESLQVDAIVDVATLTGACIAGLGENVAGLYSNDGSLRKALQTSSQNSNERVWCLPLEKSYLKTIKSNIADLKNLSNAKGGGSITAALFLQHFVKSTPWAHLDIAGPVWDYASNKPTGFGVKLLVDFVLNAKTSVQSRCVSNFKVDNIE